MSETLETLHWFSDNHRELINQSTFLGCFCCVQMFEPVIFEWIDGGTTALCPKCGVDAVLPSALPVPLNTQLLHDMNVRWFSKRV